jgi:hypothetical protein
MRSRPSVSPELGARVSGFSIGTANQQIASAGGLGEYCVHLAKPKRCQRQRLDVEIENNSIDLPTEFSRYLLE